MFGGMIESTIQINERGMIKFEGIAELRGDLISQERKIKDCFLVQMLLVIMIFLPLRTLAFYCVQKELNNSVKIKIMKM